jgi:hypothetical protein
MKNTMIRFALALFMLCIAHGAGAYEYHLQFTPASGGRGLVVAGYRFSGDTVIGDCSYYTASACSGRGCHGVTTYHYNTCTWNLFGKQLGMTSGAPAAPKPLYQAGTEIVYASSGSISTGLDTRNFGFVSTPSSLYVADAQWRLRGHF